MFLALGTYTVLNFLQRYVARATRMAAHSTTDGKGVGDCIFSRCSVACLEHMENLTMHDSLLEHTAALMDSFALLELDLSGSRRLHDISGLQNCFSLRALNLSRCIEIPPHQFRNLEVRADDYAVDYPFVFH